MGKTTFKQKKNFSYDGEDDRNGKKKKTIYSKKQTKQIDNLLRSKNVNRLLDYSEEKF
jgi:hypothetical protein